MTQVERILLTEHEIPLPKVPIWEKPFISLFFICLRLIARNRLEAELIKPAMDGIDEMKTLLEAGDGFRKGRISGRVALPNEGTRQPTFDLSKLAEGRLKAKRFKGNN